LIACFHILRTFNPIITKILMCTILIRKHCVWNCLRDPDLHRYLRIKIQV
jgi:hypothetical protein